MRRQLTFMRRKLALRDVIWILCDVTGFYVTLTNFRIRLQIEGAGGRPCW